MISNNKSSSENVMGLLPVFMYLAIDCFDAITLGISICLTFVLTLVLVVFVALCTLWIIFMKKRFQRKRPNKVQELSKVKVCSIKNEEEV